MIDLADYNTIPIEVGTIVRDYIDFFTDKNTLMQEHTPLYDLDAQKILAEYFGPYKVPDLYESVERILDKERIVCYHATKMPSPATIKKTGLKVNSLEWYNNFVKVALETGGISSAEIEEALWRIKKEKKRRSSNGKDSLCYFANPKNFIEEERPGYSWFCQNIGGELARNSLEDMPNVYNVLRDNGESLLVKFSIPFSWIESYEKPDRMALFIYREAAKYLWDYSYDIEFDGTLFKDVPASFLIDVIKVSIPD